MPSFRYNTDLRQIFLTWTIWEKILSVFACDLHITQMPTQNITSQLLLQVSYSEERKQIIVRMKEVRNEEQQLFMDSTVCLSTEAGPTKNLAPQPPPHPPTQFWWQGLLQVLRQRTAWNTEPVWVMWVTRWHFVLSLRCLWIKTLCFCFKYQGF